MKLNSDNLMRQFFSTYNSIEFMARLCTSHPSPCAETNFVCREGSEQDKESFQRQILTTDNSLGVLGAPGKCRDPCLAPPNTPPTSRTSHPSPCAENVSLLPHQCKPQQLKFLCAICTQYHAGKPHTSRQHHTSHARDTLPIPDVCLPARVSGDSMCTSSKMKLGWKRLILVRYVLKTFILIIITAFFA